MFYGLKQLRAIFLIGGMAVFAGANAWFFVEIWEAAPKTPPDLSGQAVYGASAVGGVLGTFFAAVLGLQQFSNEQSSQLGTTLLRDVYGGIWIARIAIWLYAAVGAAALITGSSTRISRRSRSRHLPLSSPASRSRSSSRPSAHRLARPRTRRRLQRRRPTPK